MSRVGAVHSLYRYPVKSMRGEEVAELHVGFAGIYGDRMVAIRSSTAIKGFPYLTARDQRSLLQFQPRFRHPERAAMPPNLAEAESLGPGLTVAPADPGDLELYVEAHSGETFGIDDPALLQLLSSELKDDPKLSMVRSDRALTDCRPISLFSVQTAFALGAELEMDVDPRSSAEKSHSSVQRRRSSPYCRILQ